MKRLFIKALKIQHQQEALFVLGIFSCIIGAILFEYDKLKYSEACMEICLICFILLLINAWLNPYIKKCKEHAMTHSLQIYAKIQYYSPYKASDFKYPQTIMT